MLRRTDSNIRLLARKRRNSDSTPPITKFFTPIKRERSISESKHVKNVSQKLEDSQENSTDSQSQSQSSDSQEEGSFYSESDLRNLLGISSKPVQPNAVPDTTLPISLENLPKNVYLHIFTILDLRSVSSLALTSTTMSSRVKCYVTGHHFFRRMQLDHLDFLDSSIRPDDDDFLENDPFTACGSLIKSITITLATKIRAQVFLNMCRNLRHQLGGTLHGFGRLLDAVTQNWKFSERRVMVKAAILIDEDLRRFLIKVLTSPPGQFVGLEMKVRSSLTELFLNRNLEVDDAPPNEVIEFGAWLSVVLRNFVEKYQGKLYYLLFGPTKTSRTGERIDWTYFCEDSDPRMVLRKSQTNYKKLLGTLTNGIRALRIMNNSESSDSAWNGKKIYQLFLRVVEVCEEQGAWSESASSIALSIDTPGLFTEYLLTCLDPRRRDFVQLMDEAAEMVCLVRTHLYRWSASPATFLSEPLHHAFNHLAQLDGHYSGLYKTFLDKIWKTQRNRLTRLVVAASGNDAESGFLIREELDGQLSTVRLLSDFSDALLLHNVGLPIEQDEQLE